MKPNNKITFDLNNKDVEHLDGLLNKIQNSDNKPGFSSREVKAAQDLLKDNFKVAEQCSNDICRDDERIPSQPLFTHHKSITARSLSDLTRALRIPYNDPTWVQIPDGAKLTISTSEDGKPSIEVKHRFLEPK